MNEVENKLEGSKAGTNEFLANERTFLAWIRTSIALMGFGFVIVKFSLFLKQISIVLGRQVFQGKGYSAMIGVIMVALGSLLATFAFFRYKSIEKSLKSKSIISSNWLSTLITLSIIIGSILLILYLLPNIKM